MRRMVSEGYGGRKRGKININSNYLRNYRGVGERKVRKNQQS